MVGFAPSRIVKHPFVETVQVGNLHIHKVRLASMVGSYHVDHHVFSAFQFWKLVGVENRQLCNPMVGLKIQNQIKERNEGFFSVFIVENIAEGFIVF